MKHILISLFFLPIVLVFKNTANAQTDFGIQGGISLYSGDLSPKEFGFYFEDMRPMAGPFARFVVSKRIALRANILFGEVSGDDRRGGDLNRGLNFQSSLFEASLLGEFSLFKLGYQTSSVVIEPYLAAGLGVYSFNPRIFWEGEWIDLQPLGTEAQGLPGYPALYRKTQFNIPLGGGVKFVINEKWTIGGEFVGRKLFSDYLDDVSGNPVVYGDVLNGNGELAARISNPSLDPNDDSNLNVTYRRGGLFNDWYTVISIHLGYRFGSGNSSGKRYGKVVCPTF